MWVIIARKTILRKFDDYDNPNAYSYYIIDQIWWIIAKFDELFTELANYAPKNYAYSSNTSIKI